MATGGTVGKAGLSWVGEQGPELLRLPAGAQVIPNGPSMAMAANSNSMSDLIINNVINVPAGTSPETAPAIAREVTKELRRQLPDAIQSYNRNPLRRAS
jgi:phage-related tail protein